MCGIVGFIHRSSAGAGSSEAKIMRELSVADIVRGYDGTGVFYHKEKKGDENKLWYVKDAVVATDLLSRTEWNGHVRDAKFCVVHNRASTVGADTKANTHPFICNNVIGVHNGTIASWRQLKVGDGKPSMDSEAVYMMLDNLNPDPDAIGKALGEYCVEYGAYSLVWWDHRINKLRFARNYQRPMNMVRTTSAIWFGSELRMLEWVLHRNREVMIEGWSNKAYHLIDVSLDGEATVHDYSDDVDKWGRGNATDYSWGNYYQQGKSNMSSIQPYTAPSYGNTRSWDDDDPFWPPNRGSYGKGEYPLLDDIEDAEWTASNNSKRKVH